MIPSPRPSRRLRLSAALGALLLASAAVSGATSHPLLDRWELTLPNGAAGWLELRAENGWYDGSLLWGGGSVVPVSNVVFDGSTAVITRVREIERKDAQGKVLRKQTATETITATADGDVLRLTRTAPRADGTGFDRSEFSGRRAAPLPPRPDLSRIRYGAPITLLAANDLSGWRLIESQAENGWTVRAGVLDNRPIEALPGQPRRRFGNLRTEREFDDFRLTLEVKVPAKSNSGVYLRGIYEVQVLDSHGKPVDSHNMGAIYSRIAPLVSAEKPAGEWQSLDVTLVDRHVTVILNGRTIIDNQPLAGVTGGALWSDPLRPGPIYLQGDHGPVSYRNIVIRPVQK